jgi:4-diphosphocytidyl-2-C-methyl-D-erythritol kinase
VNLKIKAYAKLNLFLDILGKRNDNYHEILTVMCQIDLADDIKISLSDGDGINLRCSDVNIPADERNTAFKAARLFLNKLNEKSNINIAITKKIPVMAGLGGSSADAAAVLLGLNKLFGNIFTLSELLEIGAEIGSDVPFCIHGGSALCKGRGTEIAEVLPVPDCVFVIIKPDFSCSSKEAYAFYGKKHGIKPLPKTEVKNYYNAFEILYNNPEISRIKDKLLNLGAMGACLTGSGSAVFGAFENLRQAEKAFENLDYAEKFIAFPVLDKQY